MAEASEPSQPLTVQTDSSRSPLFYGWWVLASLAAVRVVASGAGTHNVLSLLVLPMEEEFGATRASISLMATSGNIAVALTAPLGGWLMDRFGARRVMLGAILVTFVGYILLSQASALWQVIAIFTIPLGVAYNWAVLNAGAPILNNWFDRQKARALSLLNVGHGVGALLLPVMAFAITEFGWRTAVVIGGSFLLGTGIVAALVSRNTPEEMGLHPDGREPVARTHQAAGGGPSGSTLREAIRTPYFWSIGFGSACMLFINLSLVFHMVPLLESRGESEGLAATLLSFQLVLTVPIVIGTAWLADRFGGPVILLGMTALAGFGVLLMLAANTVLLYLPAMALLAFGGSNWPTLWSSLGHAYGRRHYNQIRMSIYSILIAGMSGGPVLAGLSFDSTGGYDNWLRILLGVSLVGIAAFTVTARSSHLVGSRSA